MTVSPRPRSKRGDPVAPGADRHLALQYAVSRALAESDTIAEAAERVLEHVGMHLGWACGACWALDEERQQLYAISVWSRPGRVSSTYERETKQCRFKLGEGFPGQVASTALPAWVVDIETSSLVRKAALLEVGLRGGIAFPVIHGGKVLGVIEFFSERREPESAALLEATRALGYQIGQFVARKRAWELQRAAEIRNATVVELALDSVITIDGRGRVIEFNPAAERTFGYRRADVLGKAMAELIVPPHLREQHYAGLRRYLATGEAHVLGKRLELDAMRADGSLFPVELVIMRVPTPGEPVFTSYLRDLTDQRRAEARQNLLLDASGVLASSLDHEQTLRNIGRIVVPAFADGYFVDVLDPVTGAPRRLHVDHRAPEKIALAKRLAERYSDTNEDRGVLKVLRTGKTDWLREIPPELISAVAINQEHGDLLRQLGLRSYIIAPLMARARVLGAIGFITAESGRLYDDDDVAVAEDLGRRAGQAMENARLFREVDDQRHLLEEQQVELEAQAAGLEESAQALEAANDALRSSNAELREKTEEALRARDEADQANRAKSAFLAAMSHELRTPLNAIVGYADLLAAGVHGDMPEPQQERLGRIKRSAHHLLDLINDILNFARLEAGRLNYDIRPVSVDDVLRSTEEILGPQMALKNLRCCTKHDCPGTKVRADREKLIQILVNLLSNAVKHAGENGEIVVSCARIGSRIRFSVSDAGPGIPPEKLEAIFQPFVQIEEMYVGDRQGTGLGLAISRELAHAMKGEITVESEVGAGSTFTVTLPSAE